MEKAIKLFEKKLNTESMYTRSRTREINQEYEEKTC